MSNPDRSFHPNHLSKVGKAALPIFYLYLTQFLATIKSWSHPYRGDTADLLYQYMVDHNYSTLYARLLPLVQSSGMGKSCLIDEFFKKYFVIPFNLREWNHGDFFFELYLLA
jgi:hypothetical protein